MCVILMLRADGSYDKIGKNTGSSGSGRVFGVTENHQMNGRSLRSSDQAGRIMLSRGIRLPLLPRIENIRPPLLHKPIREREIRLSGHFRSACIESSAADFLLRSKLMTIENWRIGRGVPEDRPRRLFQVRPYFQP